jgi:hypothetical protein
VMPAVKIRSRIFGSRLVSMPFFEQGGPLTRDDELLAPLLGEVDAMIEREGLEYLELRNPAGIGEAALQSQNLSKDQYGYVTFRLALKRPIEEVWKSTEKSAVRWAVRKAKAAGVAAVPVETEKGLRAFYEMYTGTMRRHGSPNHPYRFFQLIQQKLAPRIWLANVSGNPVAGVLVFVHNGVGYWSFSVSSEGKNSLNSTSLLLWHAIETLHDEGCDAIDLGRTRAESGVYDFKKRFGGAESPIHYYYRLGHNGRTPQLDPTAGKYRLLTRMWKIAPKFLTDRVSKMLRGGLG